MQKPERRDNVYTQLWYSEMLCSPHQPQGNPVKITPSHNLYWICLRKQILDEDGVKNNKIHLWTDSTRKFRWLQQPSKQHLVVIANSTAEKLENLSRNPWRLVKVVENPADNGSTGISIELNDYNWSNGPECTRKDKNKLLKIRPSERSGSIFEAEKATSNAGTENQLDHLFDRKWDSSFNRIKKLVGYGKGLTQMPTQNEGTSESELD